MDLFGEHYRRSSRCSMTVVYSVSLDEYAVQRRHSGGTRISHETDRTGVFDLVVNGCARLCNQEASPGKIKHFQEMRTFFTLLRAA